VENCQVGVFAGYTSAYGYALFDKRLYIPKQWFSDEYLVRRRKCKLPSEAQFKTKPQLAVEMLHEIVEQRQIPFRYVLADSVYGTSPDFIEAVESLIDVTYMLQMPGETLCWLKHPGVVRKTYRYRGQERKKKLLLGRAKDPVSFKTLASSLSNFYWYRRKVSEGAKGPVEYEFTKRRIVLCHEGLPEKTVWLLIRRSMDKEPRYSFFISNAPLSTRLDTLVWLSGLRWSIEQCFEETKTELGMDQYKVRKFPGWHHHILTCMLSHYFLWHLKIRLGKKSTSHYALAA
jgi:SRSO17 transposase